MALDTTFHPLSFPAINIGHTKPRGLVYKQWLYKTTCPHSRTRSTGHTRSMNCNTIPQKDTMIPYMAQPCYLLNSQVLVIFFPFATIPATPHHPEFTDKYFPQYGMSSFSLLFMTQTFFNFPSPTSTLFLNHTASPIPCTPPSQTPRTKFSGRYPHLPPAIHLI